ncbi:hypothetical protein DEJ50_16760 [Streptomyces venezuelae]|uniref:DUF2752 domain-containing protein n=1 Tax=Streptomyces venezuelae TaxID=54571 RepID=A0A5P2D7G0_STRVZ|nr:DUF2752 domain-containing protein [Streptomyces venezuelae]QES49211.1 hypothetical protein DEJ50_16760 [Streptomyces venezuelae]
MSLPNTPAGPVPWKVRALPAVLGAAAVAGAVYVYGHSPYDPAQLLPQCPWRWATGLSCPACGGTRMAYSLLHGDLAGAVRANALLLGVLPLAAFGYGRWFATTTLEGRRYRLPLGRRGIAAILTIAALWTVARNL